MMFPATAAACRSFAPSSALLLGTPLVRSGMLRMGKALVYQQRELGLEAAYQLAGQTMATNMMDADAQEGAQAFAQKRKPQWLR